jgi:hypothetical protein
VPIPQADLEEIEAYCRRKTAEFDPTWIRVEADVVDLVVTVTEVEFGPAGTIAMVTVAQLRYCAASRLWSLFWSDSEGRFRPFRHRPEPDVRALLGVLNDDPSSIFWG